VEGSRLSLFRFPLPPAQPSSQPFAASGFAADRPIIPLTVIGPRTAVQLYVVLDTGAECCLFAEWVAVRTGLGRTSAAPVATMGSSVSRTGFPVWFERVGLQLNDPAGVGRPFRWPAVVGFTPVGSFWAGRASGILGVNGGLDRFQRIEFDWSALGGPEVVVRV
jgi:hypothetical protein